MLVLCCAQVPVVGVASAGACPTRCTHAAARAGASVAAPRAHAHPAHAPSCAQVPTVGATFDWVHPIANWRDHAPVCPTRKHP
eukprot:6343122-Prymnesium_polylepis.1